MTALASIPFPLQTIALLVASTLFMTMTMAWYGHLKKLATVPFTVGQPKIMQEVITLAVFVPFAVFYLKQPLKLDCLWAALCMAGAAYFMFRSG